MDHNLLEIEIDGLTNSILNVISGDSFETEVMEVGKSELTNITRSTSWKFDWKSEKKDLSRQVFKLTIIGNEGIIQGLMSVSDYGDQTIMG